MKSFICGQSKLSTDKKCMVKKKRKAGGGVPQPENERNALLMASKDSVL